MFSIYNVFVRLDFSSKHEAGYERDQWVRLVVPDVIS
jgi:hypothetical protein